MTDPCSICFEETDDNNPLINLHDFSTSHPMDREMAMQRGLNERKHFACESCFNEMNKRGQSCPLCRDEMGNPKFIQYDTNMDPSLYKRKGRPKKATQRTGFSPNLLEINKKWEDSYKPEGTWMAPLGKMLKKCTGSDCGIKGGRKKRKKKTKRRTILPRLRKVSYKNKKHRYKLKEPFSKRKKAIHEGVKMEAEMKGRTTRKAAIAKKGRFNVLRIYRRNKKIKECNTITHDMRYMDKKYGLGKTKNICGKKGGRRKTRRSKKRKSRKKRR